MPLLASYLGTVRVQVAAEEGENFFSLDGGHRPVAVAVLARDLARVCRLAVVVLGEESVE